MAKQIIFLTLLISLTLIFGGCDKQPDISQDMNETFYVRNGGGDMPAFVRGNGSSKIFIVLLHGGPGSGSIPYTGYPYADALEEDYAMVYWDQRSQGNSHGHFDAKDLTIDLFVEDTRVLIHSLKQRYGEDISIFLMGHSWGGLLGTAFMTKEDYQNEINGWIEVAGVHDFPATIVGRVLMIQEYGPEEIMLGNNVEEWQEMLDYVNQLDTANILDKERDSLNSLQDDVQEYLSYRVNDSDKRNNGEAFDKIDNAIVRLLLQIELFNSVDFYVEVVNANWTGELHKIHTPSLILYGKYDSNVPPFLGEVAYEKINTPDKELIIYQHSEHNPMITESNLFVQDVTNFIETHK